MSAVEWGRHHEGAGSSVISAMRARLQAQAVEHARASPARPPLFGLFAGEPSKAIAAARPAAMARSPHAEPARAATFRDLLELSGFRRFGAVASGLAAIWVGFHLAAPPPPDPTELDEPHRFWSEVARPFEFYHVASSDLGEATRYQAKHTRFGGGRRDMLTYGSLGQDGQHLRIAFYRVGVEEAPVARFATEIARRAAEVDVTAVKTGPSELMPTRFGAFEVADFRLTGEGGAHACLGFRLNHTAPAFRMSGYACGDSERAMDRGSLACLLDRIDLIGAGEDVALSAFFAGAEARRRVDCFPMRNARVAKWLDPQGDAPSLRMGAPGLRITPMRK